MAKARRRNPASPQDASAPAPPSLLESSQFRQLIDTAPDAMVIVDAKGEIVIVNSQTEKVFGYTAAELIGKPVEVLVPDRFQRTHAEHHVAGYIAKRNPHARDIGAGRGLFGRRKDGSEFPAQISLTPLKTDDGMFISSFIRDLSQLRESEERFRSLFEEVPLGVFVTTPEGAILEANPELLRILDYPDREALLKVRAPDIYAQPADRQRYLAQTQREGVVRGFATVLKRRDGTPFPAELSARAVKDAGGRLVRVEGTMADLTASHRAKAALEESEKRYRTLFETVNLIALTLDAHGTVGYVNPFFLKLVGYTAEEVIGRSWFDFLPAIHRDSMRGVFAEVLDKDFHPHFENRIVTKTGEERIVAWHNTVLRNAQGRPTGTLSMGEDVTERRLAESAIRESEARFGQLAENIREAFFITDATTGQCLYVSPAYETIFGQSVAEAYKSPYAWAKPIHPEDRARVEGSFQAVVVDESGLTEVFRVEHPDGTLHWVRARTFPVRDEADRVHRLVGVAEDITELRKTEAQLVQAQKMEAVGLLAGGIAHDFNNLLGAITMFGELAAADLPKGDARREDLDSIQDAVARATTLTRQLLAFSRQQVLRPKVLDPNVVITDVLKILGRLIGEDIELLTELDPNAGQVRADESQLEQVLMNLAVNARDAMPNGGQLTVTTSSTHLDELTARVKGLEHGGDFVVLTVADTGTGMPAEVQAHAFEPFFTTKGARGTGLGLATVYGIVRQSGGHVGVASEPGRGTTFRIHLPVVSGQTAEHSTVASPGDASGGTETVLVVEDDPAVRLAVSSVLSRLGYTVIVARTAEDALSKVLLHEGPIHLVLSDVVMPGMDGPDLIKELHRVRPDMKALLTSGYAGDSISQHRVTESGAPFLEKPFTAASLAQRVRQVLDERTTLEPQ